MEKYKILPHTADGKFQAFGQTMEEAFANAALATASLMWDWLRIEKNEKHSVKIRGKDLEQLLLKFLGEIIYLLETKKFLLGLVNEIRIEKKDEKYLLNALFVGDKLSDQYEIYGNVKAITYNEMKIEKNDHVTVQVVVDM
jgi:SHS2 domain-containing protein